MTDPFISEAIEEDAVEQRACWMLPAKPLGQHRRRTVSQSPESAQGSAPHSNHRALY